MQSNNSLLSHLT